MRSVRFVSVVAALAIAAAACSSSSSTAGPGGTSGSGATGPASNPSVAGPVVSLPVMPRAGGGSCSVTITGDTSASWQTPQDLSSLLVSYWLSASERDLLSPSGEALILNCSGAQGSVSFITPNKTTASDFPMAPKDYVIPTGGILGGAAPGQISALFTIGDKSDLWKVIEPGSFKVTTFGGGKFAGTFSFKVGKVGDDLTSIVGNAVVAGTFDLGCTSGACK